MKRLLPLAVLLATLSAAHALIVELDYSYDSAGANFFGQNPAAKAAVDKAGSDIGAAILQSLGAVNTDIFTGTTGSTTTTFDWSLTIPDPTTGQNVTLNTFTFAANTVKIFVGMRPLTGSTLGVGGPSGAGLSTGVSGFASELQSSVAKAETASNAVMPRGGGPVQGSISGSLTLGATTASYTVSYGSLLGALSFDNDTNDDGTPDSFVTLANFYQYDPNAAVSPGKNDLYSIALHEILHSIGFGTSATWNSKKSGTTWLGSNAIALNGGTGAGLVSTDGGHIADGYLSQRFSDGVTQEAVMDPSLTVGTRKTLTRMDLAFLRDLGYVTIPEPATAGLLLTGLALLVPCRRRHAAKVTA